MRRPMITFEEVNAIRKEAMTAILESRMPLSRHVRFGEGRMEKGCPTIPPVTRQAGLGETAAPCQLPTLHTLY
jgi:hypothetical protein